MSQTLQNYIWLQKLFDKIKHLSKECDIPSEPIRKEQTLEEIAIGLVSVVEDVVKFIIDLRSVAEEYSKLEIVLQKYEGDIRKHIGIEQQLRLYGESLQMQLDQSEFTRFEFLEKTRVTISDLKRQNQKLHEQNMQIRQRQQLMKHNGANGSSRLDFRTKMMTQESSKERGSKSRLQTFEVDSKRPTRNDTHDSTIRTPSKQHEYKIKIQKKEGKILQPTFHSERKKDIQRKVRQLVEHRNAKKPIFQNSSYNQLYARNKTEANHPHRRSLRKSVESQDSRLPSNDNIDQGVIHEES